MSSTESVSDAVVIGGGVIGCTTALSLVRAGVSVTLVERGACGREASWAGAGILIPGSQAREDPLVVMRRRSLAMYGPFAADLRERTGIDAEYLPCGCLDLITDDNQDAAADREVAAAAGRTTDSGQSCVERLSAEAAAELEPEVTREIRGALLLRTASQIRNPRLLAALQVACVQTGVRVLEHTPATDLAVDGSRVVGVQTPAGQLSAGHVVLAAGAWSPQIGQRLADRIEVYPVRGQIVLLEKLPRPITRVIQHGKRYLVCRTDGKLLVGATEEHESGFAKRNTAAGIAGILQFAERFVPTLKDAAVVRTWAGLRPGTRDGKPYLGPVPGLDGLIAATGHFRSGLILAPITAEFVTQFVTTGKTDFDLTPFLPGR